VQMKCLFFLMMTTSCFARQSTSSPSESFREAYFNQQRPHFTKIFALMSTSPYEDDGQIYLLISETESRIDIVPRGEKQVKRQIKLTAAQVKIFADHFKKAFDLPTSDHFAFDGVTYQLWQQAKNQKRAEVREWNNPESAQNKAYWKWIEELKKKIKEL
jgi:hypothetical protein